MFNQSEAEEQRYLEMILIKLRKAFQDIDDKITNQAHEIREKKKYIWENLSQLDSVEKADNRIAVNNAITFGENAILQRQKLSKLIDSPYFGRVDFIRDGKNNENTFYIGIHNFAEESGNKILIYDWRAPVSSLFYDFEAGPAYYIAPAGKMEGRITLKRQYKVKGGQMEYMIESSLNIDDEVLQKELSQTSSEHMKNIVATIQREQNAIIRNEQSRVLIIQGVAGSGKTSIALHRVAFLLYRFKDTLTSKDILIISPNKVFGDYISNVLPELGEEEIADIGFEEIAGKEITGRIKFQTFEEQVSDLVDNPDKELIGRIQYKASADFVNSLKSFLGHADTEYFRPTDLNIGSIAVGKEELQKGYEAMKRLPVRQRLEKMAANIITRSKNEMGKKIKAATTIQVKAAIMKMFEFQDTLSLYCHFFHTIEKPGLFQFKRKNTLEFADVFPYVYVKIFFEGAEGDYRRIKHVLIDEMQDYTPIQYEVLAKLYHCKMTILGDASQSVNPYSSSTMEAIRSIYQDADCVELCKSYRSTTEIMNFAQKLKRNDQLISIERHGEEPTVGKCSSADTQFRQLKKKISQFAGSNYQSLGIICKTQKQAAELYGQIKDQFPKVSLLSFSSTEFQDGVTVTTAHMAKGLEFDQVIVPFADAFTYRTEMDRSMLYIACTRAMHKLDLTYFGDLSPYLKG
ncbi:helicase [Caproiciproducens sp. NJN-50]|uniref:HelD family protein n=1 Tax=Acutalibacteraceae TaxID=3082771 RepID=UPI000FFDFE59|nr:MULTISPECIES: UvrD-helicase domain-containing protein [Acutalibacteraceae]QAT48632.1 helicase [Caproiciproducens sp. NJN-50]